MIPNRTHKERTDDYFQAFHNKAVKLNREANSSACWIMAAVFVAMIIVALFALVMGLMQ